MAITKILNIKETKGRNPATHLEIALNYIQNPDKTEKCVLVGSVNCLPDTAFQQICRNKDVDERISERGDLLFEVMAYEQHYIQATRLIDYPMG